MRPISLEFEGINSYTNKASVDFDKLLQYGLFGIFGNTGSGKSTILDAILLALYSRTSKSYSPIEFINKKCNTAFVDFSFIMKEEGVNVFYRVKRDYKLSLKKDSVTRKSLLFKMVENEEILICEGNDKVDAIIENIMGLSFDEFEKCIILPQGQFSAFVLMTNSERKKMMGSLFDLDKYGRGIIYRIKQSLRQFENEINQLDGNLKPYESVTTEELERVSSEIENSKKQLIASDIIISKNEDVFNKNKENYERHNKLIDLKNQLEQLLLRGENVAKIKANFEMFDSAKQMIELQREIDEFQDGLGFDKNLLSKKQEAFLQLEFAIETLNEEKSTLEKTESEIENLKTKLAILKSLDEDNFELDKLVVEIENKRGEYKKTADEFKCLSSEKEKLLSVLENFQNENKLETTNEQINELLFALDKSSNAKLVMDETDFLKSLKEFTNVQGLLKIDERISFLLSTCENENVDFGEQLKRLQELLKVFEKIKDENAKLQRRIVETSLSLENLNSKLQTLKSEGEKSKSRILLITQKIHNVTDGDSLVDATNKTKELLREKEEFLKSFSEKERELLNRKAELDKEIVALQSKITANELIFSKKQSEMTGKWLQTFVDVEHAKKVVSLVGDAESTKNLIADYEKRLFALNEAISQTEKELNGVIFDEQKFKESKDNLEFERAKKDNLLKIYNKFTNEYENLSQNFKKKCIIEKDLKNINDKYSIYSKLLKLVDRDALVGFVAEEYLKEIAGTGKSMLLELTDGRFGLRYQNSEFFIEDNVLGGELRKINTISGGELFLVSLSLALSLSKSIYAKSRKPIEFFFLDEGFGSLDRELIETVMDSLNKLRQSNLLIGVITHVETLKERINAKICVYPSTESDGSKLSISF